MRISVKTIVLFVCVLFFSVYSCQKSGVPDKYLLICDNTLDQQQISIPPLKQWQYQISLSDTAIVQAYFDTLSFDLNGAINTISITTFREKTNLNFDWERYIYKEKKLMQDRLKVKDLGQYFANDTRHFWFLAKDSIQSYYIEYVAAENLVIKNLGVANQNDKIVQRLCKIDHFAQQVPKVLPSIYKPI